MVAFILLMVVAVFSAAIFVAGPSIIEQIRDKIDQWRDVLNREPPQPGGEIVCENCPYRYLARSGEVRSCKNCGNKTNCPAGHRMGQHIRLDCPLWRAEEKEK